MNSKLMGLIQLAMVAGAAANGDISHAQSVCDIALKSGAFNTSDYAQTSNLVIKRRDDICKSEYSSQQEAVSAGQQSGGNIGYGGFSLGVSDAKQSGNSKWSIADSKYCKASAEEIDSFTSIRARQQVADIALNAWTACINSVETNRLFVQYTPNTDGSGITGTIIRSLRDGGIGKISGISSNDPNISSSAISCSVGTTRVEINKPVALQLDRSKTALACKKKDPEKSFKISLITTQGDQEWIVLPSKNEQKVSTIDEINANILQLRNQLAAINTAVAASARSASADAVQIGARLNEQAAKITAVEQETKYGGSYQVTDPGQPTTDQIVNPLTNSVSCPTGFRAVHVGRIRTTEPHNVMGIGANQFACIKP